ncbi:MAG: histidine phosphatase family protein [Thermoleophilaceae bacterium]|nr:histidine phosphatase family protein [Thermoleophilaceae bacterium]
MGVHVEGVGRAAARLFVVRHGESAESARRLYSGRRDVPLTERGRAQARRAGERLRDAGVDAIYSSPLGRAADTARLIGEATGVSVRVDERLTELDYGPLEGLDREGASERFGESYLAWRKDPMGSPMPGVEPLPKALERARSATTEVIAAAHSPVIVGHQGILRLVLAALGQIEPDDYFKTRLDEAEPIEIAGPAAAW